MALMGTVDEILLIYTKMSVNLADVLLMFLYLEIVGMVSIYYQNRRAAFVYPIYIAITALTRLIILQGKEITPENILFEAIAILLLALAALLIVRTNAN
jgi:protein PsiE